MTKTQNITFPLVTANVRQNRETGVRIITVRTRLGVTYRVEHPRRSSGYGVVTPAGPGLAMARLAATSCVLHLRSMIEAAHAEALAEDASISQSATFRREGDVRRNAETGVEVEPLRDAEDHIYGAYELRVPTAGVRRSYRFTYASFATAMADAARTVDEMRADIDTAHAEALVEAAARNPEPEPAPLAHRTTALVRSGPDEWTHRGTGVQVVRVEGGSRAATGSPALAVAAPA
jgi:hypothetical protein